MNDLKFIDQEIIYLNSIDGMTGRFFTKFPYIFFPKYDLDKMDWEVYLRFVGYFVEMIMLNNSAINTFGFSKNTSEKFESMYKKYVSETEHDLRDFYDPVTKEVYTKKIDNPKNEKKKKDNKLIFPNFGHEQYINTFSTTERHGAFELLESTNCIIKKMNGKVIVQLFIFFEEILKDIAIKSQFLRENSDIKNKYKELIGRREEAFKEMEELLNKRFEESLQKIKRVYPKNPTFLNYALIIDQNCHIGMDRGLNNLLNNSKYRNFNNTRNKIAHSDNFEIKQPLSDFFYMIKEVLDYIYNEKKIIKKIDEVHEQVFTQTYS